MDVYAVMSSENCFFDTFNLISSDVDTISYFLLCNFFMTFFFKQMQMHVAIRNTDNKSTSSYGSFNLPCNSSLLSSRYAMILIVFCLLYTVCSEHTYILAICESMMHIHINDNPHIFENIDQVMMNYTIMSINA